VVATLEERLGGDLVRAMKAREMLRVYVLRGLLTAVKHLKVERRGAPLGDEEVAQLVRREMRKREEAETFAVQAGRRDLVDQNRAERAVLESYAPAQLDAGTLERTIRAIVARSDARSLGAIMGALRQDFGGRFDGRQASEIARRVLSEPTAP
jgi:uncharacterized protein YqeY